MVGAVTDAVDDRPRYPRSGQPAARFAPQYARAFLVQFTEETDSQLTCAAGRVEHLRTGRRTRFESAAELLDCLRALLAEREPTKRSTS